MVRLFWGKPENSLGDSKEIRGGDSVRKVL